MKRVRKWESERERRQLKIPANLQQFCSLEKYTFSKLLLAYKMQFYSQPNKNRYVLYYAIQKLAESILHIAHTQHTHAHTPDSTLNTVLYGVLHRMYNFDDDNI